MRTLHVLLRLAERGEEAERLAAGQGAREDGERGRGLGDGGGDLAEVLAAFPADSRWAMPGSGVPARRGEGYDLQVTGAITYKVTIKRQRRPRPRRGL